MTLRDPSNHSQLPPRLPDCLVLDVLAVSADLRAHQLAAAHAGGTRHNLEAHTVLDDHITEAQLKREDELHSLWIWRPSFPGHEQIVLRMDAV